MFSIILTWVGAVLGLALLVAMAAGAFFVDFDDVLTHNVEVVEKPFSSRADVDGVRSLARHSGESSVCVLENAATFRESREETSIPARRARYRRYTKSPAATFW